MVAMRDLKSLALVAYRFESDSPHHRINPMFKWFKKRTHKFPVGTTVIFINDFGVVYRFIISEQVIWETYDGKLVPAYHYEGTQTPWFPLLEKRLFKQSRKDRQLTDQELQQKYGFIPEDYYGCY